MVLSRQEACLANNESPGKVSAYGREACLPVLKRNDLIYDSGGVMGLLAVGTISFQRRGLSDDSIEKSVNHTY